MKSIPHKSASVEVYAVSSIRVPANLNITRKLHPRNANLSKEELQHKSFDRLTVFYDVFYHHSENKFIGIGPRLLNLKKSLMPMQVRCNEMKLPHRLTEMKTICILEVQAPDKVEDGLTLNFEFPVFSVSLAIDTSRSVNARVCSPTNRLTISTIQKNNHIEWIEDWIRWHRNLHNVQRVILYDNGSSDRQTILRRLKDLDIDVNIVFVEWPFEYGQSPDKFAQRGAMNHCRLRFSIEGGYCINTDLDEYLVNKSGQNLLEHLDSTFKDERISSIRTRESWIPRQHPRSGSIPEPARVWHQSFRRPDQGIQPFGKTKYIYKFNRVKYNSVHVAIPNFPKTGEIRLSWKDHLIYAISNSRFLTAKIVGLNQRPKTIFGIHYAVPSKLFYHHLRGLRRKPTKADTDGIERYDPDLHQAEPEINELSRIAGLIPRNETDAESEC
ncbi:MAG: glycosyltransferase family 2 protein [Acidiferrobacterales bacterium]|nr:glycosyltransferase family 2 protein [Acidiferrobacterales bacterium]